MPTQIKCGPSGGPGGSDFEDAPSAKIRITKLTVWHGKWVDAIQVFWPDGSHSKNTAAVAATEAPLVLPKTSIW
jgi:hypothetical protein